MLRASLRAASPQVGRRVQHVNGGCCAGLSKVVTPHPRFARPPHKWGGEFSTLTADAARVSRRLLLPTRASRGLPPTGEAGSAGVSRRLLLPTRASRDLPTSGEAGSAGVSRRLLLPTRASRDLPTSGEAGSAGGSRRLLLPTRASRGLPTCGEASSGSCSPPALRAASPQVGRRY